MDLELNLKSGDLRVDPSFEYHLGRRILKNLKEHGDEIQQIDVATGEKETHRSVFLRSVRVAEALSARNLNVGDVIMIYSAFHNDASIPFIASMYLGVVPVSLAPGMTQSEIRHFLKCGDPKIIFVDADLAEDVNTILHELKMNTEIVTFQKSHNENFSLFSDLSHVTGTEESFKCREFDPETTTCFAVCSSGTTGLPKLVAFTHKAFSLHAVLAITHLMKEKNIIINYVGYKFLCFAPMVWISAIGSIIGSCIYGHVRIQNSGPYSPEIATKAFDLYKPHVTLMNPVAMFGLGKYLNKENLKLDSLIGVYVGGSAINWNTVNDFQKCVPNGKIYVMYGTSESGITLTNEVDEKNTLGSLFPWIKWKVVDIDTEKILGPNRSGELRVKSIQQFQKYWNDSKSTNNAFDSDGYYKTGDMFYYDEDKNLYFVDRCKEVIKHMNYQISTIELEEIISRLPEVSAVGVVGLKDPKYGELPMAFVQVSSGANLSAQMVKDIVKNNLSDYKQLRGGVVFLDKIPLTHSGKINRKSLNELKNIMKGQ